jgi:sporulation related protein
MRTAPSSAPAAPSGNDPLAELARLIGQNDPFAEFGRQNARQTARAAQQQPAQSAPAYADDRYAAAAALDPAPPAFAADGRQFDNFPQQYGAAPLPNFPSRGPVPGFPPEPGFGQDPEYPTGPQSGAEDHAFYDEVPPRRRLGIVAIAAICGLVVIGTAGAFGYRALFGSSGAKSTPPVIKAESSPTKIVPATQSKDPKSGKLIYDRVAERGQDEKLVSREEQPVDRPPGAAPGQAAASPAPMGSGIVATEPKKVHTIAIRPDGTAMADAAPTPAVAAVPQPPPVAAPAPAPVRPVAAEQPPPPQRAQPVAHTEPPPRRTAVAAPSGGPLSLSPDAPSPAPVSAPVAPRPARTAVAAPTQAAPVQAAAPASGGGGYAVQVSSQRSEAEAQAAFHSLAAKYPNQLGGKQALVRQVDLGAKGVYFRAMVGPMASEEASQLCSSLKAAGGQCIIQRN